MGDGADLLTDQMLLSDEFWDDFILDGIKKEKMAKKVVKKKKSSKASTKRYVPAPTHTTTSLTIPAPDDLNQPSDDLRDYIILLMGAKAIGKTEATSTFPGCLNFQWEPNRRNIPLRMVGAEQGILLKSAAEIMEDPRIDPWIIFKAYMEEACSDDTVATVAWDTVDIAYDACFESVCARLGYNHPSEISDDYGNSWKLIQREFMTLLNTVKSFRGIVLTSHTQEREVEMRQTRSGTEELNIIAPSCAPACIKILKSACDFWFYYGWHDAKRRLYLRDPDNYVDVACGTGFIDKDTGEPIMHIDMPEHAHNEPNQFYDILNNAFHGIMPGKESKKSPSRTTKKKARRRAG